MSSSICMPRATLGRRFRSGGGLTVRDRDRRGSAASDWAEAQSGLPDWGVRGAWDLGAHNPTPDLELWSRRGMIKQPFADLAVWYVTLPPREMDGEPPWRLGARSSEVASPFHDLTPTRTKSTSAATALPRHISTALTASRIPQASHMPRVQPGYWPPMLCQACTGCEAHTQLPSSCARVASLDSEA